MAIEEGTAFRASGKTSGQVSSEELDGSIPGLCRSLFMSRLHAACCSEVAQADSIWMTFLLWLGLPRPYPLRPKPGMLSEADLA